MNMDKYPNHCSQCGAPLIRKHDGKVSCEYCGMVYYSAPADSKEEIIEKAIEDVSSQNTDANEYPSHWMAQINVSTGVDYNREEPDPSIVEIDMKKLDGYIRKFFIFLIVGSVLLMLILEGLSSLRDHLENRFENKSITTASETTNKTPTNAATDEINLRATEKAINRFSLTKLIFRDQYSGVVYPAASNEDLPVATAVVLEYADANNLIFSLFVYNQNDKDIDISLLQQYLDIDSLAVTSDLEDEFICSLQKDNWEKNTLRKYQILRKGLITCSGSLNPESSSIDIDFDMPNWGSSHLEVPIQANNVDLQSSIELKLEPDSYQIEIEIHSVITHPIWIKKQDIVIRDDQENEFLLDNCFPAPSQQGEDEYFFKLTYPSGDYEKRYDGKLTTCVFNESFPAEINTMSASLKTKSGKIFKSHAVINKSEGTIHFTNETANQESILQLLRHNQEILDELQIKINER